MMRTLILLSSLTFSGCALFASGQTPLKTVRYGSDPVPHRTLVVLLPGRFDDAEDFARAGFIAMARARGVEADFLAVEAHLGYYRARTIVPRLHADVMVPAHRAGYTRIWLLGISLGGMGALLYLKDHPESVAGAALLSPYLGRDGLVADIARAGSLAAWQPPQDCLRESVCGLWRWLRDQSLAGAGADSPLWLGYGERDRFPAAHRLLAEALTAERSLRIAGGHDWDTWRQLWSALLDHRWPAAEAVAEMQEGPSGPSVRPPAAAGN